MYRSTASTYGEQQVSLAGECNSDLRFDVEGKGGSHPALFATREACESNRAPIREQCIAPLQCEFADESAIPFEVGSCKPEVQRMLTVVQPFELAEHESVRRGMRRFEQVLSGDQRLYIRVGDGSRCVLVKTHRERERGGWSGSPNFMFSWTIRDSEKLTQLTQSYRNLQPLFGRAFPAGGSKKVTFHDGTSGGVSGWGWGSTTRPIGLAFLEDRFLIGQQIFYFRRKACEQGLPAPKRRRSSPETSTVLEYNYEPPG